MPSIYAHRVFGEMVSARYPASLADMVSAHNDLFQVGLHGPDLLFYHYPLSHNPVNRTGYEMHDRPANEFFGPAAALVRKAQPEQKTAQTAYLLGFLAHFSLDHACHSYIENKIAKSKVSHAQIEVDFDRFLLLEEGNTPLHHKVTTHLHPSAQAAAVIAPFFPGITQAEVEHAFRSMVFYNDLLTTANPMLRGLILTGLRLSGKYDEMRGQLMNKECHPSCADSNLRLKKLMDRAVDHCLTLTQDFLPCLERETALPPDLHYTFGPEGLWQQIPVLPYEEEQTYEI